MPEQQVKRKSKTRSSEAGSSSPGGSSSQRTPAHPGDSRLSSFYSAGPVHRLVQKKAVVGPSNNSFEREADAVSNNVSSGQQAPMISRLTSPGSVQNEERKQEPATGIQRVEKIPEEPVKAVQKLESKKEEPAKAVQRDEKKAEEVKPVQKQEKKPESVSAVQRREDSGGEESVQTKKGGSDSKGSSSSSMNAAASHAISSKGAGQPLNPSTRSALESGIGADFGNVRVHEGSGAQAAADALNARAFTHQNDIWLGRGESQNDLGLMAHEATHVVQQTGMAQRLVQRNAKKSGKTKTGAAAKDDDTGEIDDKAKTITYKSLKLPKFKATNEKRKQQYTKRAKSGELLRPRAYDRKDPKQDVVWDASIDEDKLKKKITGKLKSLKVTPSDIYALKHKKSGYHIIGTVSELVKMAKRPSWDREGEARPKDVDHVVELQVSGWDRVTWPNTAGKEGNMELMDSAANQDSGRQIMAEIVRKIQVTRDNWPGVSNDKTDKKKSAAPSIKTIKKNYDLIFKDVKSGLPETGKPYTNYWTWEEISEKAVHLDSFEAATKGIGGANKWTIFPSAAGGEPKAVEPGEGRPAKKDEQNWFQPFDIKTIKLDPISSAGKGEIGKITLAPTAEAKSVMDDKVKLTPVTVKRLEGLPNSGYLDKESILELWRSAKIKGLSPLSINAWDVVPDKGFIAYGSILSDVPLIKNVGIDLVVTGKKIEFKKIFDAGDFTFPGQIQVTSSSLEVYAGTAGVGVRGEALFEIDKLGDGKIGAGAGVSPAGEPTFAIVGEFNFDTNLFTPPANVKVWYRDRKFGGEGEIGIDEGRIKGIRSARIKASFEEGKISASGTVKPSIPGVEQGDISLVYSETEGMTITGGLQLKKDIPGIKSGCVQVTVRKKPDEERYIVSASGKAEPNIPGVATSLSVTYDDGAFDVVGSAAYEKGMLKGSVTIGATNRPVGADGKPTGPPAEKADKITLYGGGSVTVRLTPWLQGTAGIKLLPNGEVEITGSIALPASLDIFPEKKLDKNIFKIGIDIPIVGVAVAGQRIGIFATISGGLDLNAGIGPGQLREMGLSVTYNPAHEDQTQIKGGAQLFIPAHAGLRLFVRGALGAGIPVVSAQAGLEVGGELGIEGAVVAGVQVDWTPSKGLVLDAVGEIYAEPKFKFDISGYVLVEADLWLTTIELYSKRWQFASFEYGSGLRLGAKFPIHYEEGKPFDISLNDVQFQVPDIKPKELLSDLIDRIA